MKPEIKVVESKKDLKAFVKVPFHLYKDHPYWVPPMISDEMEVFNEKKNPAYEHAESRLFIAYLDGQPVGRVAAILSHAANNKYKTKNLRFGWFESIEDFEVTETLLNAVQDWGRERGMETLTGPHGFTDMDPQGMLFKGFDMLATIAGIYNFPYYPEFMEKYGFTKEIDYHEFLTQTPKEKGIPEKLLRIAERVKERSSIKILEFKNNKEVLARGEAIFKLIDESFEEIYGTTPFTPRQIDYYVKKYISYLDKEMIKVAVNPDDEVVGFMFTAPSMSKAFRNAKGRLFPFGWYHLLKAMKERDIIDFYMAGVNKKYQGKGVDLLMVIEIVKMALEQGFNAAESNQELEDNTKVQALWKHFNPERVRERRIYRKNF
jgi:ribosomal protein S18 acetylase RimI-like enzyme